MLIVRQAQLIIVAGLPGSGKTTYLHQLKAAGYIDWHYDDFQDHSRNKSPNPKHSRYYGSLIKHLRYHQTVAVADIRYCTPLHIQELLTALYNTVPHLSLAVEAHYFENNPQACLANVEMRARALATRNFVYEAGLIKEYSAQYEIASNLIKLPILPVRRVWEHQS